MVGPLEPTFGDDLEREESSAMWLVQIGIVLGAIVVLGVAFSKSLEWVALFAVVGGVLVALKIRHDRRRARPVRTP